MIKGREPVLERISVIFQVILTLFSIFFILWISGLFAVVSVNSKNDYIIFAMITSIIWYVLLEFLKWVK